MQRRSVSSKLPFLFILFFLCFFYSLMASETEIKASSTSPLSLEKKNGTLDSESALSLESVRESLIRQEDTIVFSLIERANFPLNLKAYNESSLNESLKKKKSSFHVPSCCGSLVQYILKETEDVLAKVGRYDNPEEHPFFPNDLPEPFISPKNYPQVLHPAASSVNINEKIWNVYLNQLLPLLTKEGDDGEYVSTATRDIDFLQALSRRIHYGKFVAEVKFRGAPEDYSPAIRSRDRDALMKLLTFTDVEDMVKRRVARKAMVFGQEVSLNNMEEKKYKVDPALVSQLYGEWVMPLTKLVQVEYLLRRLD